MDARKAAAAKPKAVRGKPVVKREGDLPRFKSLAARRTAVKEEAADDDTHTPEIPPCDIGSVIAAALAVADKRAEERMVLFAGQLAAQLATIQEDNTTLKENMKQMKKENATLSESMRKMGEENSLLRRNLEKQVGVVAEGLERVRTMTSHPQNPTHPVMTVATPCGPSTFAISYPNGGKKAEVIRLKNSNEFTPIHFPNARIPVGSRCMIEVEYWVAPNAVEKRVGLWFGFTPINTKGLNDQYHALDEDGDCFWYCAANNKLSHGSTELWALPEFDDEKRLALLMDRTHASHTTLRLYVGDCGKKTGMRAHGNEVVIRPPSVDYIPVANPIGECQLFIRNISYGNQIEFGSK